MLMAVSSKCVTLVFNVNSFAPTHYITSQVIHMAFSAWTGHWQVREQAPSQGQHQDMEGSPHRHQCPNKTLTSVWTRAKSRTTPKHACVQSAALMQKHSLCCNHTVALTPGTMTSPTPTSQFWAIGAALAPCMVDEHWMHSCESLCGTEAGWVESAEQLIVDSLEDLTCPL